MTIKNLGVLINNMGANQISYYVTKNINDNDLRLGLNVIVYYEILHLNCIEHKFASMNTVEMYNQRTPMIATCLSTAYKLLNAVGPTDKWYYVYDLEWQRPINAYYELHANVLQNPKIKLMTRNEEYKTVIETCFNRKVEAVVDDFNLEQIKRVIFNG